MIFNRLPLEAPYFGILVVNFLTCLHNNTWCMVYGSITIALPVEYRITKNVHDKKTSAKHHAAAFHEKNFTKERLTCVND